MRGWILPKFTVFLTLLRSIKKGIEARIYVEKRLAQNGNQMLVETGKRGKWHRWIATIYLADSPKRLNEELIEKGLARRVEEE